MDHQPPSFDPSALDPSAVDPFAIKLADHVLIRDKTSGAVLVNKNGRMVPPDQAMTLVAARRPPPAR